jgi:hypothetical protein
MNVYLPTQNGARAFAAIMIHTCIPTILKAHARGSGLGARGSGPRRCVFFAMYEYRAQLNYSVSKSCQSVSKYGTVPSLFFSLPKRAVAVDPETSARRTCMWLFLELRLGLVCGVCGRSVFAVAS